jgi:hypothetical protein
VELIIITLKINLLSPWYRWKIAELVLKTITHSLTHSLTASSQESEWSCICVLGVSSLFRQCCILLFFRIILLEGAVDLSLSPDRLIPKTIKFCSCWFSANHAALMSKSKDWLARNQNNVSEWGDISHDYCFSELSTNTIKIKLSVMSVLV